MHAAAASAPPSHPSHSQRCAAHPSSSWKQQAHAAPGDASETPRNLKAKGFPLLISQHRALLTPSSSSSEGQALSERFLSGERQGTELCPVALPKPPRGVHGEHPSSPPVQNPWGWAQLERGSWGAGWDPRAAPQGGRVQARRCQRHGGISARTP